MYFALFFLLFFTIDMLLTNRFSYLGMIPMNFLVAGVGVFSSLILLKHRHKLIDNAKSRFCVNLLFVLIVLTFFYNFFKGIMRALNFLTLHINFVSRVPYFLMVGAVILMVALLAAKPQKIAYSGLLLYCAVSLLVRFGFWEFHLIFKFPRYTNILIWRYLGVLDLFMLFGWLVLIDKIIREEFGYVTT